MDTESSRNFCTLVIEIGVSQDWGDKTGLDAKAKRWFKALHMHGLEYILCIKICKDNAGKTTQFSYKLYDLQQMHGIFPNPTPDPIIFSEGILILQFDSRRMLRIAPDGDLPHGVSETLYLDLSSIRDEASRNHY